MSDTPEFIRTIFFFSLGVGIAALGVYNVRHRTSRWWNSGFPVFSGIIELIFGSAIIIAMIYHFNELVSE